MQQIIDIQRMHQEQIQSLTPEQLATWTSEHIQSLTLIQIGWMSAEQRAQLGIDTPAE